jgi:hypothetical protein
VDFSKHLTALTKTNSFTLAAWVRNAKNIVFSVRMARLNSAFSSS